MNLIDVLQKVVDEFNIDIDLVQAITSFDFTRRVNSLVMTCIRGCRIVTPDTVIIYFIDDKDSYCFRNKSTKDMVNSLIVDGWKQIEISKILGISQATVSNILKEKD